jgi:hypothetical protein
LGLFHLRHGEGEIGEIIPELLLSARNLAECKHEQESDHDIFV